MTLEYPFPEDQRVSLWSDFGRRHEPGGGWLKSEQARGLCDSPRPAPSARFSQITQKSLLFTVGQGHTFLVSDPLTGFEGAGEWEED